MKPEQVAVFFYGLFMDEALLVAKGIRPSRGVVGYVEGYSLRIGTRATLVPNETARAYGVLMTLRADEARALYSDETVADYVAEPVFVVMPDETIEPALCYNLPEGKLQGTNAGYATALLKLARELGLPNEYLADIEGQLP